VLSMKHLHAAAAAFPSDVADLVGNRHSSSSNSNNDKFRNQFGLTNPMRIALFCYCPATLVFSGSRRTFSPNSIGGVS